ncbi:uncharacterized protein [Porites lutea]|uniref:uncharacterized protein n=1 Tax=Porites lutea TaxID=51062 RepID=UPI003CC5622D
MEEIMREIEISCSDECKTGLHNCHDDPYCTNTKRSFTCTCKPGYTGDGVNCEDINECETRNNQCDADISACYNTKGSYKCVCMWGFSKSGHEHKCTDINECETGKHSCDNTSSLCQNTKGSFRCVCREGYIASETEHNCTDRNECESGNNQCDPDTSLCVNTKGSYKCVCMSGFSKSGHEHKCADINECETGKHNCNATSSLCHNTKGSFRCVCREGYNESVPEHNCTAERVDASVVVDKEELHTRINALAHDPDTSFGLKSVTYHEVIRESKALKRENKAYFLQVESKPIPVYCHMEAAELRACGGGGWTLVMKTDGKKNTFHYDSKLWTNKTDHNPSAGKTLLDDQETKLPTYWSTPFTKICLAMKIGHQVNSIVINKPANSLHSLIADGKYRLTSLGRDTWKKLIGQQASLQRYCNKEGFNSRGSWKRCSRARIGIISNQEYNCVSPDSRIGFGTGGYPADANTCGNIALHGTDNGDKNIKAMCYILVQ